MKIARTEILEIVPFLMRVRAGWLAVSEPGSPLRIGVQAETPEDARLQFQDSLRAWAELGDDGWPTSSA